MEGLRQSDFLFELPAELIAQSPLADRSASRLLKLDRAGGIRHGTFRDILGELNAGDCLVLNDTKVLPARLLGERAGGGTRVELLLLRRLDGNRWEALARPGRKARTGDRLVFGGGALSAEVEGVAGDGNRMVRFEFDGVFEHILDRLGEMPLPPYIHEKLGDRSRYQTVYAKNDGSAAAPTAGLHFTEALLAELAAKGVKIAKITLHVGLGTFRPVKAENILEHKMHSEFYNIEREQADIINGAKKAGGRVIAAGTTVCRTLETRAGDGGLVSAGSGRTDIFIYPGYRFKIIDGLITNFHLPGSTLIMLVSALAGRENVLAAYEEAVRLGYRFYSFGDCCLVL